MTEQTSAPFAPCIAMWGVAPGDNLGDYTLTEEALRSIAEPHEREPVWWRHSTTIPSGFFCHWYVLRSLNLRAAGLAVEPGVFVQQEEKIDGVRYARRLVVFEWSVVPISDRSAELVFSRREERWGQAMERVSDLLSDMEHGEMDVTVPHPFADQSWGFRVVPDCPQSPTLCIGLVPTRSQTALYLSIGTRAEVLGYFRSPYRAQLALALIKEIVSASRELPAEIE